MSRPVKFGVYLPEELASELEELSRNLGIKSKSRIVQEALRLFITEHRWRTRGSVCGAIGVLYNHEIKGVDEKLTDIQHKYLDVIIATVHVHLDPEKCMLLIVTRGSSDRVRDLVRDISGIRGVLLTRTVLLESE
ncbi:MAG: CopG family ribbon-helix-helix protein [Thermoprotei archaeon]